MCGRYDITDDWAGPTGSLKYDYIEDFKPHFNAAPLQELPVVLNEEPNQVQLVRWGLKPFWYYPEKESVTLINVKAENLREKPTFKADLKNRRCLVLATGFYEWQQTKDGKQPYRIVMKDRKPFFFAGIWQLNKIGEKEEKRYAIITTAPNSVLLPIHMRMPVVLRPGDEQKWLEEPNLDLLGPYPPEKMEAYKVSRAVNSARNDSPLLLKPIDT